MYNIVNNSENNRARKNSRYVTSMIMKIVLMLEKSLEISDFKRKIKSKEIIFVVV